MSCDSLLVEEVEGLALVAGQLLQGAALLLDRRLHLGGGGVVLDVDGRLHRRLLGRAARRAEQTAETGGVRAGKWRRRGGHTQTYRGVDTSSSSTARVGSTLRGGGGRRLPRGTHRETH